MAKIIKAQKLSCFSYKADERSSDSSHTGLIPLWLTNQDGQLKTLQRQTTTSPIILCLCLTNRPSQLKGADCRRGPPETNKQTHAPNYPIPPSAATNQTAWAWAHTRTQTHTQLFQRQTQESSHSHTHFTFTVSLITR